MMILATKVKIIGGVALASTAVATGVAYSSGVFTSKTQKINELVKKENKHILLSFEGNEDLAGWKAAWEKYGDNKVWGEITKVGNEAVPEAFKNFCKEKTKDEVYGTEDQKYTNITTFCSRDKLIADVLKENGINLLASTGKDEEWKTRFDKYKETTNKIKLPNVEILKTDTKDQHYSKISTGCTEGVKMKTTASNYENNLNAIKHWCKE